MKELTVNERAKKALSIDHTEKELTALAEKFADVAEISNDDDYSLVKGACREFQKVRVSIEKAGKAARDDANKFSKAVLAEQKRLLNIIVPEEDRLKALRKEVDERAVREAAEKLKKEEERVDNIKHKIEFDIRGPVNNMFGKSSAELETYLSDVTAIPITKEEYQEFFDNAVIAKNASIAKLSAAIAEKKELEALRASQEEQEKRQAEEQARIDAENEKIRLAQEAIDKEKREIAAKKLAEKELLPEKERLPRWIGEIKELEALAANKLAEAEAAAKKLKEENEKLEREKREKAIAEQKRIEEEAEKARQKELLPEKERLLRWIGEIDELANSNSLGLESIELMAIKSGFLKEFNQLLTDYIKVIENA